MIEKLVVIVKTKITTTRNSIRAYDRRHKWVQVVFLMLHGVYVRRSSYALWSTNIRTIFIHLDMQHGPRQQRRQK